MLSALRGELMLELSGPSNCWVLAPGVRRERRLRYMGILV